MDACLDDNLAAEFASGALPAAAARRVDIHLSRCRACRGLVAALAPVPGADSDLDTAPRDVAERAPRGKRGRAEPPRGTSTTLPATADTAGWVVATADRGPRLGDTVGRYLVLGRLGAGGMGVVLSAYDPQLDRKVALKLLRAGSELASSEGRARLVREAQAIAQLSHPNVVAVYDVGTTASGEVYIAMELVDGETLTQHLRDNPQPWRYVLDLFLQAGRGLVAAHAVGLLHRDFKPDNVLVGADGRVRVTDFGLARSLLRAPGDEPPASAPSPGALHHSLTATGTILGTPRYMAPEQLRGDDADARADQFSFCVALYEALYGRHPLAGDTAQRMIDTGDRAAAPPDGPVPAWVSAVLVRGLDAAPARRFPSMSALLGALTPPPPRATRRWAALGVGVILVAGGAALARVATPDAEPAVLSPRERSELLGRINALESERTELLDEVGKQPVSQAEVLRLRDELRRRDEQIQQLVVRVAAMQGSTGARRAAPAPAVRSDELAGLSRTTARDALASAASDAADCLREWWSRHPDDDRVVVVDLSVLPEGRAHSLAADGLGADPTVDCVTSAVGRSRFPARSAQTRMRVTVRFVDGVARLDAEIVGYEPAPVAFDIAAPP